MPNTVSFEDKWRERKGRSFRDFCSEIVSLVWHLPFKSRDRLNSQILKRREDLSVGLREAANALLNGQAPNALPRAEAQALALWIQLPDKYSSNIQDKAKTFVQALDENDTPDQINKLWTQLVQLIAPSSVKKNDDVVSEPVEEGILEPAIEDSPTAPPTQESAESVSKPVSEEESAEAVVSETITEEAPTSSPELPVDVAPAVPVDASPNTVASALQKTLVGWQQVTTEFSKLMQRHAIELAKRDKSLERLQQTKTEQAKVGKPVAGHAAELAKRDAFIKLVQQQKQEAEDRIVIEREEADKRVKRTLMRHLAEPLDFLYDAAMNTTDEDLAFIYESFEEALAELQIFPVGEIGRKFTVGPNDLVQPEDGQPVADCKVEQTGWGWNLQSSNGATWPLIRPRVRRINTIEP